MTQKEIYHKAQYAVIESSLPNDEKLVILRTLMVDEVRAAMEEDEF